MAMNEGSVSVPEAVENALREVCKESLATIPNLWIRTSRNLEKDLPANGDGGEAFPQLCIGASPKYYDNVGATWCIDIAIDIYTHFDDDPGARHLAELEAALEALLDRVFIFPQDGTTEEQERFVALVRDAYPAFNLGACYSDSASGPPTVQDAARALAQNFTLRFSFLPQP